MDLYELRTGFKDWRPIMSIPEKKCRTYPIRKWLFDQEADRLIDSWILKELKERNDKEIDEFCKDAFKEGFTEGESQGIESGKVEGYKEGYADARNYYEEMKLDK